MELKEKLSKYNYSGTLENTKEMINKYIKIKDNLSEKEKKEYLEILNNLCGIYSINLRNELKDYITEIPSEKEVFDLLCFYYLNDSPILYRIYFRTIFYF